MHWPKYATYLFLKYFISKTNPSETYITVHFAGEVRNRSVRIDEFDYIDSFLLATIATELSELLLSIFDILKES